MLQLAHIADSLVMQRFFTWRHTKVVMICGYWTSGSRADSGIRGVAVKAAWSGYLKLTKSLYRQEVFTKITEYDQTHQSLSHPASLKLQFVI